jgi:hypothetical protein
MAKVEKAPAPPTPRRWALTRTADGQSLILAYCEGRSVVSIGFENDLEFRIMLETLVAQYKTLGEPKPKKPDSKKT